MTAEKSGTWALLALRLVVGYGFMAHGFAKVSRGPEAFAVILQHLNVPLPTLAAWLTIGTEILGGLAMFLGAFVAWVSIPMAFVLVCTFRNFLLLACPLTRFGARVNHPGYWGAALTDSLCWLAAFRPFTARHSAP